MGAPAMSSDICPFLDAKLPNSITAKSEKRLKPDKLGNRAWLTELYGYGVVCFVALRCVALVAGGTASSKVRRRAPAASGRWRYHAGQ
jgi:hypothetical protein